MRSVVNRTQSVSHRVNDTKSYVAEAHTCDILTESHTLSTFLGACNCATKRTRDDFDSFEVEHIRHFPSALGGVALDSVGQCVHTRSGSQALRHSGHKLGVNDCNDRDIVYVYAHEFALFLSVCDNVVDSYFCRGACRGRNGNDRHAWIFGRCNAFQTSNVAKLRVGYDDTDSLSRVDRRATAYCK